jgi:hypothetical protein
VSTFAELDDVTFDLEVDGESAREELARRVWEWPGWAAIACAYRERTRDGAWRAPKVTVIKLRRQHEAWKRESSVTLDGQLALDLAAAITSWRERLVTDDSCRD